MMEQMLTELPEKDMSNNNNRIKYMNQQLLILPNQIN